MSEQIQLNAPETLILNERLYTDIFFLHQYTIKEKQETAGFIIRATHGGLGIVSQIFGKDKEVDLIPHEQLHEGETYLGSCHFHPNTNYWSGPDVATFLADRTEQISMLGGNDGTILCMIRTLGTEDLVREDIKGLAESYTPEDLPTLALHRKFLFFKGKDKKLTNMSKINNGKELEMDIFTMNLVGLKQIPNVEPVKKGLGLLDRRMFEASYSNRS